MRVRLAAVVGLLLVAASVQAQTLRTTTLTADATTTAATLTVASTVGIVPSYVVFVDREAMRVLTVPSLTSLQVERDKGGIGSAHGTGSLVYSGSATAFSREDPLSKSCVVGLAANPYVNLDTGTVWTCSTGGIWVAVGQSGPAGATLTGNGAGKPWTFTTASVNGNVPAGGTAGQVLTSTGTTSAWSSRPVLDGVTFLFVAPFAPADGTVWVEVSGTSPTRVASLLFRDGGVTRTLMTVTY